ncbi:MAG: DUF3575 domain-containing protein, partial [Muribaculaceae bacterium]|nr:DUF3575 domain-containing protein [Muribaculaceae bacterium]
MERGPIPDHILTNIIKRQTLVAILFVVLGIFAPRVEAQKFAVKTNIIYDALANINLGIEAKLAPRWTLDVNGDFNDWTFSEGKRYKHW